MRNRDSVVSVVIRLRAGRSGVHNLFYKHFQTDSEAQAASHSSGNWGLLRRRLSGWGVNLTTHLHLLPRLGMNGAIPPHLHAFMACMGMTLHLPFPCANTECEI
jgi:hypothetical protein